MSYIPKVVTGKVKGTGLPIDGHTLYFSQWDYDNYQYWHLYGWNDADNEAVMMTVWQTENEAGLCIYNTLEEFIAAWKVKGKYAMEGVFCLDLDQVEVQEIIQEEQEK